MDNVTKTLKKVLTLQAEIEKVKPLYEELDTLSLSLVGKEIPTTVKVGGEKYSVSLVDNFAEKNTAFRTAAVKRWELKLRSKLIEGVGLRRFGHGR